MNIGVATFLGSNCDRDVVRALQVAGASRAFIFDHPRTNLKDVQAVILPGGFSYGDYLRSGAIAAHTPLMQAIQSFANHGGVVIGICNGFQILCEAGLLPGALLKNEQGRFVCKEVLLKIERGDTPLTDGLSGRLLRMPVAHGDGRFFVDPATLNTLYDRGQIVFRYYQDNPNGSVDNIAGICSESRRVIGLMPHPERAVWPYMASQDGLLLLRSLLSYCARMQVQ